MHPAVYCPKFPVYFYILYTLPSCYFPSPPLLYFSNLILAFLASGVNIFDSFQIIRKEPAGRVMGCSVCVCLYTQHGTLHWCTAFSVNHCSVILKGDGVFIKSSTVVFCTLRAIYLNNLCFLCAFVLSLNTLNSFSLFSLSNTWHTDSNEN